MEIAMPTAKHHAMSSFPDSPANLALSDLALDAAIELERFQAQAQGPLQSVGALSKALTERGLKDLALVSVYDRALASGGASGATSKSDLHSRLEKIALQLSSSDTASSNELELLRDFCVALHDALLTSRVSSSRQPVLTQRRVV